MWHRVISDGIDVLNMFVLFSALNRTVHVQQTDECLTPYCFIWHAGQITSSMEMLRQIPGIIFIWISKHQHVPIFSPINYTCIWLNWMHHLVTLGRVNDYQTLHITSTCNSKARNLGSNLHHSYPCHCILLGNFGKYAISVSLFVFLFCIPDCGYGG